MNHRIIILLLTIGIVTAIVGGVMFWNWPAGPVREDFGPGLTSPTKTSPLEQLRTATSSVLEKPSTPAIGPAPAEWAGGVASANPTIIAVNEATDVVVTIPITDSRLIPGSVNLQRLDATGKVIAVLGTLNDAGTGGDTTTGDRNFTIRRSFTEATTTPVRLQVSWGLRDVLHSVLSNIFAIQILPEPILGPRGGTILTPQGVSLSLPPLALTRQVRFSISTVRDFQTLERSIPPEIPIFAGITISATVTTPTIASDQPILKPALTRISIPLNTPLLPASQLLVLTPSPFLDDWQDNGVRGIVNPDGTSVTFETPLELTTFILIRPEDRALSE